MAIEKPVKIRKDRKCDCCGKIHKKGSMMLFKESKGAEYDDNEIQIGIKYHRYYYCYDGKDRHYIDDDGCKISLLPCA